MAGYPIDQLDDTTRRTRPVTLLALQQWMQDRIARYERSRHDDGFDATDLKGKIYTSSSIEWLSSNTLEQTGNAPNFSGSVWSLATCKHHMRSVGTFTGWFSTDADGVYRPDKPVFIYTLAGKSGQDDGRNAVASMAMVTNAFETVEAYGRFLAEHCSDEALACRRTRGDLIETVIDGLDPRRSGDCHVGATGEVGPPNTVHQHRGESSEDCHCGEARRSHECTCGEDCGVEGSDRPLYERDLDTDHLKCISMPGYWLAWPDPSFVASKSNGDRVGRAPAGLNIHSFDDLADYLDEASTGM